MSSAARSICCRSRLSSRVCAPTWNEIAAVPSGHDPAVCLADMLENIERMASYVAGMSRKRP